MPTFINCAFPPLISEICERLGYRIALLIVGVPMCMFCASIPIVVASGAKFNAAQLNQPDEKRKPIGKIAAIVIALLAVGSVIYHSQRWQG